MGGFITQFGKKIVFFRSKGSHFFYLFRLIFLPDVVRYGKVRSIRIHRAFIMESTLAIRGYVFGIIHQSFSIRFFLIKSNAVSLL